MSPQIIHLILSSGLPVLVGFGFGRLARGSLKSRASLALWGFVAIVVATLLQYVAFFFFGAWMTGSEIRLQELTPEGLLHGLAFFSVVALIRIVPLCLGGYACGLFLKFGPRGDRVSPPPLPGSKADDDQRASV